MQSIITKNIYRYLVSTDSNHNLSYNAYKEGDSMYYTDIVSGTFILRVNRFIAKVLINNEEETVHVKNTGRCKELFLPGTKVYLQKSNNPERKTKYSLISIYKNNLLINIDSQVPNAVVYEGLLQGKVQEFKDLTFLKREVTYGNSRFDLYYETAASKGFIEVKGVTLENSGIACFPDAPTQRGNKHVLELIKATQEGYTNYIFFLIQMEGISHFKPNIETDPTFSQSLQLAKKSGVSILCYNSIITKDSIEMNHRLSI